MFGPIEEHDLFVRPRYLPDVWRPHVRMPHLSQDCGKTDSTLLNVGAGPKSNERKHNLISNIQRHIQKTKHNRIEHEHEFQFLKKVARIDVPIIISTIVYLLA